ncbi:MAG: hypothetical protein JWO36_4573 [Myxococcales bacterium]|nr:hypothetical protein [Myxococcales bacterium]
MKPRLAPLAQGLFYVASGLWPIVHLRSFEAVTGPKRDKWLVQATGALIGAVGAALCAGAFERRSRALAVLGVGSATALGLADVWFTAKRQIPPVYLGDAAVEAAAIGTWIVSP